MSLDLSTEIAVRWHDYDPKLVPLLQEGGITTVLLENPAQAFEDACRKAGLKVGALADIQFLPLDSAGHSAANARVALTNGIWPGVSRGPKTNEDEFTAGASALPWVDANGYFYGMLRALYPDRPALLGYLPDEKAGVKPESLLPYDSLELGLIEAWVNGGNYLLSLEPRYHARLLRGEAKAAKAWRRLGRTARWLVEHGRLFGQPTFPAITVLVEANDGLAEITNLLYRQNASPSLVPAADPPKPDPSRLLALVAVGIQAPGTDIRRRILSHAEAGSAVIVDAPGDNAWWRSPQLKLVRRQEDRELYSLGRGQVVAYQEAISDPYNFAFDVIDVVTQKRRAARLWNAPTAIALATSSPPGANRGRALLHLINYGSRLEGEVLVAVQGSYSRAALLRPEGLAQSLRTARRETATEVTLPDLERLAVVVLD
jgi:hypothetical protein